MRSFTYIEGNDWRLFLMQYFKSFVAPAIKFYPEVNTDFESPHSKLEICHKSQHMFTSQKRWRQILYFCMFIISRPLPFDVIWCFTAHIVEKKTETHKKLFIVTFHQNLWKSTILKTVRSFLRSVYYRI